MWSLCNCRNYMILVLNLVKKISIIAIFHVNVPYNTNTLRSLFENGELFFRRILDNHQVFLLLLQ